MGSGEKFLCGGRSEGKILADLPERRDLSGKEGCGQSFIRIREKQKNKGMKDSRYPPPDAAGKGEEHMKKDLKRQIITALAVTAVLGAAGGMTAQADFNADTILAPEGTRDTVATTTGNQYFYGVTGGNVYLDSNAKNLVGEINDVVNYKKTEQCDQDNKRAEELANKQFNGGELTPDEETELAALQWKQFALTVAVPGMVPGEVSGVVGAVNDKTLPGSGTQTIKEGTTLNLKGYEGKGWVRYYGAIGGDVAVDTGLTGQLQASASVNGSQIVNIDKTYEAQEPTVIDRTGNVNVNIGSADGAVSVIGGVGGSAAMAAGNLTMDMDGNTAQKDFSAYNGAVKGTITAGVQNVKLQGSATTNIHGNINTVVDKNATVLGWMNGGLAAGIGGTASSTVTGDTTLTIDGTGRTGGLGVEADKTDTLSKILNGMKGSADNTGVNAVGVLGGGTAVTTLGGTAEATVGGSTIINVNNASVVGLIGGGAAASVDATGVLEQIYKPDGKELQLGRDDGTSDINGQQIDKWLQQAGITDEGIVPDALNITASNINQGGEATSTVTGATNITLTGDGTAIGVLGGGAAVASHTYTWRADGTNTTAEGYTLNDEYGVSKATATTGKSHITIALTGDEKTEVLLGGNLNGRGEALGVFGGGAAIAQSGNRQFVDENNKDQALSTTDGAFATAETAGSEINVESGHVAGVFGGGIAAVVNNATATAAMTDTVDINIMGEKADVSGVVGGGLAYFTGTSNEGKNPLKGMATAQAEDTNINVQSGTVAGILGGGMAIDDSDAAANNATATTTGTATINVNGGEVNTVDVSGLTEMLTGNDAAEYIGGITNAAGNAAIAAGGAALGGGAVADVANAVVNINGGEVQGNIYGGGIAAYGWGAGEGQESSGVSHVGTSTINLNGGTVTGNVYAGGAVSSKNKEGKPEGNTEYMHATATVDKAVINLAGGTVDGILYGTGTVDGAANGASATASSTVGESTLNLIGTNTLALASGDSKIQDFTNVVAKAGSETVVTDENTKTTALISGGKVTVEDGASLNVEALDNATGTYKIADQTADTSTFWKDSDLIYDRMGGYYATGVIGDSNGSYDLNVAAVTEKNAEKAADSMTDALGVKDLRGMFREGMSDQWSKLDKKSGTYSYLNDWQLAENKTPYQKGMLFGEDAAVTGNTVSIARAMADNVTQRLSFTDDYVQEQGWANQDGGVWAKYMHRKYETDGMSSSVGGIHSSTDYDGVLVGMDFAKSGKFQSGVAIHYGSGEGDGLISHNDYDAWGITLYGSLKDEEAGTNLMADIGWMTSDNDIDGTVAGKRMSADRDVDAWTIGIRGEKEFVSGKNQIVPYAGLRYMSVNPGSYTTYYDGQAAFHNDAENQDLWLLPIGVSFRNETVTNSGWRITPKLDLSYIWAFGDTDTDMTVNAGGYTGNLYYDVMDDSSWLATLGVEAEKDAWTFGINYGYQKGDDTKNKTWYVTAGYSF